jgi:hypothetical protein
MDTSTFASRATRTIALSLTLLLNLSAVALPQDRQRYLPDPKLTPGDTIAVTKEEVCGTGHTALIDAIPVRVKGQVFDRYGISTAGPSSYNIDHLIPVKLGGSNSIKNLWPQPLSGEWNYVLKNKLEKQLQKKVCRGELELSKAQQEIATDWVSAYKKYVGEARRGRPKLN